MSPCRLKIGDDLAAVPCERRCATGRIRHALGAKRQRIRRRKLAKQRVIKRGSLICRRQEEIGDLSIIRDATILLGIAAAIGYARKRNLDIRVAQVGKLRRKHGADVGIGSLGWIGIPA